MNYSALRSGLRWPNAKSFLSSLMAANFIAGCAAQPPSPAATSAFAPPARMTVRVEGEGASSSSRRDRIRNASKESGPEFARMIADSALPAVSLGVVVDGELVWNAQSDSAIDADTLFRIGSVTKTFTGLALMKLRDEGKVALDAPIAQYVPELAKLHYPTKDSAPITARELMTHASGLPRMWGAKPLTDSKGDGPTEAELLASIDSIELARSPGLGASSTYSNLGAAVAGIVVSRASGQAYESYVRKSLLDPLGMKRTTFSPAGVSNVAVGHARKDGAWVTSAPTQLRLFDPAGGLYSSINDLAHYISFEIAAWPPRDDADDGPVRRSTVRESQLALGFQRPSRSTVGAFWSLLRACGAGAGDVVEHNGALPEGFSSKVTMAPSLGIGVIALSNGFDLSKESAIDTIADLVLTKTIQASLPPIPADIAFAARTLAELGDTWDEAVAAHLFGAQFQAHIPLSRVRPLLASSVSGKACTLRPISVSKTDLDDAEVRLECGFSSAAMISKDIHIVLRTDTDPASDQKGKKRIVLFVVHPSERCL